MVDVRQVMVLALTVGAVALAVSACGGEGGGGASGPGDPVGSPAGGGGPAGGPGVAGVVTAADGEPIVGAVVEATSLEEPPLPVPQLGVITAEDGRYRWPLGPGRWQITVSAPGYEKATETVEVPEDSTVTLDLTLQSSERGG